MGQGQWSLDCLKEIRKQLNTPEDNWIPKTNSSQMPSSYPVIDRKLHVQKSAPSWHPHAMATGFNAPGFVSKNHGGRGTAEAERDRERINATKTYSKRSTQLKKTFKKTVQCKHFIIRGVASTKAILLGSVRIHDIIQWFFLPPRGERANLWPKLSSEKRAGDRTGCSSCGEMECK